ncbi:unnamed protein product [Caenorhabditis auriculariae]|uniref:ANK_REP_REGION domain-containing protein n=1 Tax=Caenorhabditis auriculariae TaxID=2777116 RepID=A0A8S1GSU7_9PELO|nr:unnamed protein product [Caenorhabditis auriculariae]
MVEDALMCLHLQRSDRRFSAQVCSSGSRSPPHRPAVIVAEFCRSSVKCRKRRRIAMDHSDLISELPEIEKMTPQERIALAKERRRLQLRKNDERERALPPPRPRRPRLKFSAEVALLEATGRADVAEVERLLNEGANPNSHNEDGLTPLHQCAIDDNQQIMVLLLERGANVNAQDTEQWTPLHAAACCAHINVVRILIAHNANLLAVNADGNMPYDICDDETTLDAIESEMAARGITQAYIDEQRGAPEKAMLDDMKALHQQGRPLDARGSDGSTYLHVAAANGYYDVAAFLLRCGASPGARDNDLWQPVHAAACWAQPDLIELICEYGGDINAKTSTGETPMDLCEDPTTRSVISTVVQSERRRRLAFGVRDSRRQSKKRKKFESPQQGTVTGDNPFSARGAIRRQSLRDRSGMTPARIEAQKEGADILRSWSKEDVSSDVHPTPQPVPRDSPNKRVLKGSQNKAKPMSPDEWLRKLETNGDDDLDSTPKRAGSQRRRPKKGQNGDMQDLRVNGDSNRRQKSTCDKCVVVAELREHCDMPLCTYIFYINPKLPAQNILRNAQSLALLSLFSTVVFRDAVANVGGNCIVLCSYTMLFLSRARIYGIERNKSTAGVLRKGGYFLCEILHF